MRKPSTLFALAAFASLSPAAVQARDPVPAPPSLLAVDKAHVLGDTFTVVKTVKQIPAAVQKALGMPPKKPLDGMADAGEPFALRDAVSGKLASRGLVFAAVNARYCLIYYEQGGIGYSLKCSLYHRQGRKAVSVWNGILLLQVVIHNAPTTLAQLRTVIRQGRYQSWAASS